MRIVRVIENDKARIYRLIATRTCNNRARMTAQARLCFKHGDAVIAAKHVRGTEAGYPRPNHGNIFVRKVAVEYWHSLSSRGSLV